MVAPESIQKAIRIVRRGGVIAYPTEGVFGLGCLPQDASAVARVLQIKKREVSMGLVLIASNTGQLATWIDLPEAAPELHSEADRPVTWIVPAAREAPSYIRGDHAGIAVRLTLHPVASALCETAQSALVSTSANLTGRPPTRNSLELHRQFGALVDYIVPGECGSAAGPSEIRDLKSGKVLRPA